MTTILEEAESLVGGARQAAYGHPLDNFTDIAAMVSVVLRGKLKQPLKAEDMLLVMACVKLAREAHRPGRDNLVDLCGYARLVEMVGDARVSREASTGPRATGR